MQKVEPPTSVSVNRPGDPNYRSGNRNPELILTDFSIGGMKNTWEKACLKSAFPILASEKQWSVTRPGQCDEAIPHSVLPSRLHYHPFGAQAAITAPAFHVWTRKGAIEAPDGRNGLGHRS